MEEAPEVRFDDMLTTVMHGDDALVGIDPKFIEVCEHGSIKVCGCVPNVPVLAGASVMGTEVLVRLARNGTVGPVAVSIRITGIRKGFAGLRFPDRTREQFESNERFINSAYPQK